MLLTVLEVAFLAVFWSWALAALVFLRNTLLPKLPLQRSPSEVGLESDTVRFPAADGLALEGWRVPAADPEAPWLILCHGLGANRADLLEVAADLHTQGFNLLLFDFRGHGGSAGRATSFGWTEQMDLQGALAYLGAQPEIPARLYGVYGSSMGGVVGLLVAGEDERIGAIATDSTYADLDESLRRHLRLLYPILPAVPFAWYILWTYRLRFGLWPRQVSPRQAAAKLGGRPLLAIQGELDVRLPADAAQILAKAAGARGEAWVVEGAVHLEGSALHPGAYGDRLSTFFRGALQAY
ncbi:MAG: alpha/beta fold hydrolase [Candidatus Omnitrophica bacterium]|nr:alpha/beta fold hydrolase [Candidatus Omnitrophota bacterium]